MSFIFDIAPASVTLGRIIARGAFGTTVHEADVVIDGHNTKAAVKSLHIDTAPQEAQASFLREIGTLKRASFVCQRACRMLGCCKLDGQLCIVMSLYPKSAAVRLQEIGGPMDIQELRGIAKEVLEGLAELHAANIWHMDLKPPNVLLDKYGHAYLSDFGISKSLRTLQQVSEGTHVEGTPHYMAPEQADAEHCEHGPHSDVWGFAACILHLATGQLPYAGLTFTQMNTAFFRKRAPTVPNTLPEWLQDLLRDCFKFDTAARPSILELQQAFQQANHVHIQSDPGIVPQPVVQYAPQSLPQLTSQQATQGIPPSPPVPQPQHVHHAVRQTTNVEQIVKGFPAQFHRISSHFYPRYHAEQIMETIEELVVHWLEHLDDCMQQSASGVCSTAANIVADIWEAACSGQRLMCTGLALVAVFAVLMAGGLTVKGWLEVLYSVFAEAAQPLQTLVTSPSLVTALGCFLAGVLVAACLVPDAVSSVPFEIPLACWLVGGGYLAYVSAALVLWGTYNDVTGCRNWVECYLASEPMWAKQQFMAFRHFSHVLVSVCFVWALQGLTVLGNIGDWTWVQFIKTAVSVCLCYRLVKGF